MSSSKEKVAHVLLFPYHAQGHLPPMLELARLLSTFDLYVTVLDTNFYNFPVQIPHSPDYYSTLSNFRFLTFDDSAAPHQLDIPKTITERIDQEESRRLNCKDEYRRLLGSVDGWPPVTCVIADCYLPIAADVPEDLGLPIFLFRVCSACSGWLDYSIPDLIKNGQLPFAQDECDMDKEIHGIREMEGILRRRDLPSYIRDAKSVDDKVLQFIMTICKNLHRAVGQIFNTVEALEGAILSSFRSVFGTVYNVGPLHEHASKYVNTQQQPLQKDEACLTWLDAQSPKTAVYVSFGSTTKMSKDDLLEFWHGLMNSGYPFLWVIRDDLVIGDGIENKKIVEGLKNEAKERGCIVSWAPQKEVLGHAAVGCFLTHSGWNSTLESVVAGVPMIAWPFFADQMINSRFVSEVWKIGMDMKDMTRRSIVEKMIREVMEGEKSEDLRKKVKVFKKLTADSIEEDGSSRMDLKALVEHIKSLDAQAI